MITIDSKRVFIERIISDTFIIVTDNKYNYSIKTSHIYPPVNTPTIGQEGWLKQEYDGLWFYPD